MSKATLLNRRSFAVLGGASLLSGCLASPDMLTGALTGGAGKDADFGQLIKSLHAALDKVADQTEKLFLVQASYAEVFGLKKRAASLKGQAIAIKRDGRTGVNFRKGEKETKGLLKDVQKKINGGAKLDAAAKRKLQNGMKDHARAIEKAWVGGIMIAKVVIDAQSAKKPTFKDLDSLKYLREIVADGPMAMKFLETSKSTYESYSDAFSAEYAVKVPAKPKVKSLMGSSRGRA